MNRNLEELSKQAKQYAREQMGHTMDPLLFSAEVFQQKFAELIVKECARIADEFDDTWTGQGAASADAFKAHFGVK